MSQGRRQGRNVPWEGGPDLLLARRRELPPDNVTRWVVRLKGTGHLAAVVMPDEPRCYRLTRPQDARIRPDLGDDAVAAHSNDPHRVRIALGTFEGPAFAVGGGRQHPGREHAVLRADHGLDRKSPRLNSSP